MIVPYYQDELATLYHGDSIEVLARLADEGRIRPGDVRAVVTDPPYASGARTEAKKTASGAMVRGGRWAGRPIANDQMTTTGFVWLTRETLLAVWPFLAEGAGVLSFIDWRQWENLKGAVESCDLRVNKMIVWDKITMGMGHGYRSQHELVCFASKGVPMVYDRGVPDVLRYQREPETELHPSPKPIPLMERLLSVVAAPGDLVVDPFGGAGATAVAAKSRGVRSITIEKTLEHCETTATRLSQARLFTEIPVQFQHFFPLDEEEA